MKLEKATDKFQEMKAKAEAEGKKTNLFSMAAQSMKESAFVGEDVKAARILKMFGGTNPRSPKLTRVRLQAGEELCEPQFYSTFSPIFRRQSIAA